MLGTTEHELFVAIVDDLGHTEVYNMGRPGHDVGFHSVPPGHVPFTPIETWPDRLLLVTIVGDRPSKATVRIGNFENRARPGWRADSPAAANASSEGVGVGYAHMDVVLTDLIGELIETVENGEPGDLAADGKHVFIDPDHGEVLAMVSAAELEGGTVTLSSAALPGLHLLRRADATTYERVDDAEMSAAVVAVANRGGVVVSAKLPGTETSDRYAVVRHVGHSIDGAEPSCPAICKSAYRIGDNELAVSLTFADHGEVLEACSSSVCLQR